MIRAYKIENPDIRRWFLVEGEESFTEIEEHYRGQNVSVDYINVSLEELAKPLRVWPAYVDNLWYEKKGERLRPVE